MDLNIVKKIIRSILKSSPAELPVHQLQNDFEFFMGKPIPFKDFGHSDLHVFLNALTDTVRVEGQGTNAVCAAIRTENNKRITKFMSAKNSSRQVKKHCPEPECPETSKTCAESMTTKGEFLIGDSQKPVEPTNPAAQQVNQAQSEESDSIFGRALASLAKVERSQKLKRKSLILYVPPCLRPTNEKSIGSSQRLVPGPDLSNSLDDSLTEEPLSMDPRDDQRMAVSSKTNCDVDDVAFQHTDTSYNRMIRMDRLTSISHHIPYFDFADCFKNLDQNEFIFIYAAEFYSPHRFWFHLQTNCEKFDDLMERLNDYYCTLSDTDLGMDGCNITIGRICAVRFVDHWSRAEIIGDLDAHNQVKINYIDYNTVRTVPMNHIKFLKQEFCALPRQAFRGCLTNILPKTWVHRSQTLRCWHLGATKQMMEHMQGMVQCKVDHIDYKKNIVYMRCIDIISSIHRDYTVNDVLCYHSYAFYDYGADRVLKDGDCKEIEKHFATNYSSVEPTFDQLEKGVRPTYADLMENGFDEGSSSQIDSGGNALDEKMSSNPFEAVRESTNPFVDVSINLNYPNPFIDKDYDINKSLVLVGHQTFCDNYPKNDPASPKAQNVDVVRTPIQYIPVVNDENDFDSDSDNMSILPMEAKFTNLSRSQQELTMKVDNVMQTLEDLKKMWLNDYN